ncbi:MAG: hypothetical protein IKE38_00340 [Erysipelotrichaceae bacterium]|nr:hypothetical protein [Erysipelotrichaceae bacterium]
MTETGEIRYPDGSWYSGEIIEGLPNGRGVFHDYRGDVYAGTFIDGDKHGEFVVETRDGDHISCEFNSDAQYSEGIIIYHNGDIYIGYIQELEPNGCGLMYKCDGTVLKGRFTDGKLADEQKEIL